MRSIERIALVTLDGSGPTGKRQAMDFGVMSNIDGERGVKIKTLDYSGVRVRESEGAEFTGERVGFGRIAHVGFDHDSGCLIGCAAETNQRAAVGAGVRAKNLLARLGV